MFYNLIVSGFLLFFAGCHGMSNSTLTQIRANNTSPVVVGFKHSLPKRLRESSGLCYTNGNLWTLNDAGNRNEIYKIDSATGAILQTVVIENFPNVDWEDITADSLFIYIGDFGNNNGNRKDLKIIRINKINLHNSKTKITLKGEAINFKYSDQTNFFSTSKTNFDCESLISINNFLYIFTKDGIDLRTRCYKIPDQPGSYTVSPISSFDTKGKITAAAYNIETKEIVLLGYMNKKKNSFIWFLNGYPSDDFFGGTTVKITIGSEKDWQTEGIDYISPNRLFMSCESSTSQVASLYFVQKN